MRRHALLIGINDYSRGYFPDLQGCINDVRLMERVLRERYGFGEGDITRLENSEATRQAILDQLARLEREVRPDDIVVVHYSGHGSVMTDREGDSPSGVDETLVPHDSGRKNPDGAACDDANHDITDDEIYDWLLRMSEVTPFLTLIIDSCHSGGMSRELAGVREVIADDRPVEELPPSPIGRRSLPGGRGSRGRSRWFPEGKDRYVFLAACRDREQAHEVRVPEGEEMVSHGALSYHLAIELLNASAGATYRDVFGRARVKVTAARSSQHPQFEAALDREVFGVRDVEPTRHVVVKKRRERALTLAAGAAHGVTVGSLFAVHPSGAGGASSAPSGMVKIRSVAAFEAEARILKEADGQRMEAGFRAVEHRHDYGDMRTVVEIVRCEGAGGASLHAASSASISADRRADGLIDGLLACLDSSLLLRPVRVLEPAGSGLASSHVTVYLLGPRKTVLPGDRFPQLGPLATARWVVTDASGHLIMPTRSVEESGAGRRLCDDLEKRARYQQVLALDSRNREGLAGKVAFELMRRSQRGEWKPANRPDRREGVHDECRDSMTGASAGLDDPGLSAPVFTEGEFIGARIVNECDRPVFVSLFEFGLSGSVSLLFPFHGAESLRVAPKSSTILGSRHGEELELYIPESMRHGLGGRSLAGMAHHKLIITRRPVDFGFLAQDGASVSTGTTRGESATLEQLLAAAYHGGHDGERRQIPYRDPWHTITRSFWLRYAYP